MIQRTHQEALESIIALNMALEGNRDIDLTEQESERNIADNLVVFGAYEGIDEELPDGNVNMKLKAAGTGLLITTDGFVITAYHNIAPFVDDWQRINEEAPPTRENIHSWMENMRMRYSIVEQNKKNYPIDPSFLTAIPSLDIALIKAVTFKKPEPINFRVITDDLKVGDQIKLLGLRDQRAYNQYGKVVSANLDASKNHSETGEVELMTYDTFLTDTYGVPGFSGGVFTTLRGELAGLALYIQTNGNENIGHAGGAKAQNIVNLVKGGVYGLNKIFNKIKDYSLLLTNPP